MNRIVDVNKERDESTGQLERPESIQNTRLQSLLENDGLTINTPQNPWNIRASSPKFRDSQSGQDQAQTGQNSSPQIKLTDLQKLIESSLEARPARPDMPWNIRESSLRFGTTTPAPTTLQQKTQQLQLTDLQALFQNDISARPRVPENIWDIRNNSSTRFAPKEESVNIKLTDLQELFESSPELRPVAPTNTWKFRPDTGEVEMKLSDLQKLFEAGNGLDVEVPETKWDIREAAKKFREEAELRQEADREGNVHLVLKQISLFF